MTKPVNLLYCIHVKQRNGDANMNYTKTQINTVTKLLGQMTVADLKTLIDQTVADVVAVDSYKQVFNNDTTALEWFTQFCDSYGLTPERVIARNGKPYGLYFVKEFGQSGYDCVIQKYTRFFQLWIKDGHQNADTIQPHIELGASFEDLWWHGANLAKLENMMHKICQMRGLALAA